MKMGDKVQVDGMDGVVIDYRPAYQAPWVVRLIGVETDDGCPFFVWTKGDGTGAYYPYGIPGDASAATVA